MKILKYQNAPGPLPTVNGGIPFSVTVTGKDTRPIWKKMYQNPNLGDTSEYYNGNILEGIVNSTPIVGDGIDVVKTIDAIKNKDYTTASFLGAGLLLPNIIEKPLKSVKTLYKGYKNNKIIKKAQEVYNNSGEKSYVDAFLSGTKPMYVIPSKGAGSEHFPIVDNILQGNKYIDLERQFGKDQTQTLRYYINENKLKQTIEAYKDLYKSRLGLKTDNVDDIYNYLINNPKLLDLNVNYGTSGVQDLIGVSLGYGPKDAILFNLGAWGNEGSKVSKDIIDRMKFYGYDESVPGIYNILKKNIERGTLGIKHSDTNGGHVGFGYMKKQGGKMNTLKFLKNGGSVRKMQTAAGGPIKVDNTYVQKPQHFPSYRYQYIVKDLGGEPGETLTQEDRDKRQQRENNINAVKNVVKGLSNTFGTAISGASLLYGGGWALNRLLNANKASNLGQFFGKYVLPSNALDNGNDAIEFIVNPTVPGAVDLGTGVVLGRFKDFGKKSRQVGELIGQGANIGNMKKGGGIHIKEKNKGKFTSYCGGKVTNECIQKAKSSGNPTLVKRATFADNARKWKHKFGGNIIKADNGTKLNAWQKVGNFFKSDQGKNVLNGVGQLFTGIMQNSQLNKMQDQFNQSMKAKYDFLKNNVDMGSIKQQAQQNIAQLQQINPEQNFGEIDLLAQQEKLRKQASAQAEQSARYQVMQDQMQYNDYINSLKGQNTNSLASGIFNLGKGIFGNVSNS